MDEALHPHCLAIYWTAGKTISLSARQYLQNVCKLFMSFPLDLPFRSRHGSSLIDHPWVTGGYMTRFTSHLQNCMKSSWKVSWLNNGKAFYRKGEGGWGEATNVCAKGSQNEILKVSVYKLQYISVIITYVYT